MAAYKGNSRACALIVKTPGGKQLLSADDFGDTPLHVAARHNQSTSIANMVMLARKEEAAVGLKNMDGETALDVALKYNHEECIRVLKMFYK